MPRLDLLIQMAVTLAGLAGVYTGQRAEFAALSERVAAVQEAQRAQAADIRELRAARVGGAR